VSEDTEVTPPKGMMLPNGESFVALMKGFSIRGFSTFAHGLLQAYERLALRVPKEENLCDDTTRQTMYVLMVQAFARNKEASLAWDFFKRHFMTTLGDDAEQEDTQTHQSRIQPTELVFDELIRSFRKEKNFEMVDRVSDEKYAMMRDEEAFGEKNRAGVEEQV